MTMTDWKHLRIPTPDVICKEILVYFRSLEYGLQKAPNLRSMFTPATDLEDLIPTPVSTLEAG